LNVVRVYKGLLWENGCEGVDWMQLAKKRIYWVTMVNTVTTLLVPFVSQHHVTYEDKGEVKPPCILHALNFHSLPV
jgi:hypothetical protein